MNSQNAEQLNQNDPAYLADYGLTQIPFSAAHDDRFLYLDPELSQRLNLIRHTIQYSNLLLIVRGESGVGKTSLLTRFVKTSASDVQTCVVSANPMMDAGQLMYQTAKGFNVRRLPLDSGDLQSLLYEHIANLHHLGRVPILIVDDAHTLPKDALLALHALADAQVGSEKLLRIMLFCTPQIDKILASKDLRALGERVTHNMEIPPFDDITTAEYLKHRLAVAGFNGGSPFTPDMVKRIYKASGGIPARINKIALEMLDRGVFDREEADGVLRDDSQQSGSKPYRRVFLILLAAIGLALFIQYRYTHVFDSKPVSKTIPVPGVEAQTPQVSADIRPDPMPHKNPAVPVAVPESQAGPATKQQPTDTDTTTLAAAESDQAALPDSHVEQKIIPLHPQSTTPAATGATTPAVATPADTSQGQAGGVTTDAVQTPPSAGSTQTPTQDAQQTVSPPQAVQQAGVHVESIDPDPVPASKRQQTLVVQGSGFTRDSHVFVTWGDHDQEIPLQRVKYVSPQRLEVALTVGTGNQHWELRVNDRLGGNSNSLRFDVKDQTKAQTTAQTNINGWVADQNPGAATLQLFGSHELSNAQDFIRQHQLGKQAHTFLGKHNGGDWYSVVYGVYPDQVAARNAIKTLPASLSKIKPWVRSFSDIQTGIGAVHTATDRTATAVTVNKTVKPPPLELASADAAPKAGDVSQNESWIWSQDPSSYTLQLMGAHDEASIRKYLQQNRDLAGNLVYFQSSHDGREWYTVIYGVYANRNKADAAIRRLPKAIQKHSPWIRQFASIHAELSRTK